MRKGWMLVCMLVLLQACGIPRYTRIGETPAPPQTSEMLFPSATKTPEVTATIPIHPTLVTSTSTATPTAIGTPLQLTSTPTWIACLKKGGKVEVSEFTTVLLSDPLVYRVYLPPCYDEQPERSYPVLYLFHGQTSTDTQWDRLGAPETADQLIATGQAAPFMIVMPRDRSWLEPTEDNFGLAVVQSLVPWVDEHYRTIPNRAHRAVGGLSRGAAWAVHVGMSHPELFGAVGVHSGFVFFSDLQPIYTWLDAFGEDTTPRIYMDIGDGDQPEISDGAAWLEDLLTRFNIPHEWHMYVGEHEESYWQSHMENYLLWYSAEWEK